ncbi:Rhodanese-related sulfurtransferase [Desulfitobacterium dichloroeliminans LMG P-21439]|uniref:Rhodanese-related sulfurtransferase n=1 Tax=Desulfitobacterium dichloroeliminans (strain LMG P-21439 / DCA1) TaxID=871963 RepID=L0F732_DESDL|nr:rhodanese-like domain-containing protein [Desulfitobacterium dichloroeliminans]AGA68768.1 Rhodanese-related sulfurtransferase [Desulfitobacterium dichloroeliminans LMG P-21439]
MLKQSKALTLIISLLLTLSLVTGCGSAAPAAAPPAKEPAQQTQTPEPEKPAATATLESNTLAWDAWSAKMTGTINKDYYIVDLRTPDEIKLEKALEGSINIDANATLGTGNTDVIDEKLQGISKDAVVLIHCKSGGRAKKNLQAFLDKGYVNTFALDGWTAFDTKGYFGATKITGSSEQLKPDAWVAKMQGTIGKDYYVVDARDKAEYDKGHIEGALNFGVRDQFTVDHPATIAKINTAIPNKDALVLVHCAVGARAKVAQAHLKSEGYTNVLVLDNKITIDAAGKYAFE